MKPFEAVIFDLDGTLIDSLGDLAAAMNTVLSAEGFPCHEIESYRRLVGEGVANLVRRAIPERSRDRQTLERCVGAMRREYAKCCLDTTRLYTGIAQLLDGLSDAALPMAVLSNKPHDMTRYLVDTLLGAWSFAEVVGAAPERPRKPDPSSALAIARAIDVSPRRVIYLGDTGTDMATANAAGMYALGVTWGFREPPELLAAGARRLVEDPADVISMLA